MTRTPHPSEDGFLANVLPVALKLAYFVLMIGVYLAGGKT